MIQTKTFFLNGQKYISVNKILTIFDLINYFNYNKSLLVLEYNNLICNKKNGIKFLLK
jgi:sulfur carrier protein ThiS